MVRKVCGSWPLWWTKCKANKRDKPHRAGTIWWAKHERRLSRSEVWDTEHFHRWGRNNLTLDSRWLRRRSANLWDPETKENKLKDQTKSKWIAWLCQTHIKLYCTRRPHDFFGSLNNTNKTRNFNIWTALDKTHSLVCVHKLLKNGPHWKRKGDTTTQQEYIEKI